MHKKELNNLVHLLLGLTVAFLLAAVGLMYPGSFSWGMVLLVIGLFCGFMLWIVVFMRTKRLHESISTILDQLQKTLAFVSTLQHCQHSCLGDRDGWPFGEEYKLLKGRDKALNLCISMLEGVDEASSVKLISSGLRLENSWKSLLDTAALCGKNLKVIVSEDHRHGISDKDLKRMRTLAETADVRQCKTYGIRILLVKNFQNGAGQGYMCNSTSIAVQGDPKDYWTIYSHTDPTIRMMELVFDKLMESAEPFSIWADNSGSSKLPTS